MFPYEISNPYTLIPNPHLPGTLLWLPTTYFHAPALPHAPPEADAPHTPAAQATAVGGKGAAALGGKGATAVGGKGAGGGAVTGGGKGAAAAGKGGGGVGGLPAREAGEGMWAKAALWAQPSGVEVRGDWHLQMMPALVFPACPVVSEAVSPTPPPSSQCLL